MTLQRLNFGTDGNNDGEVLRTAFPKLDANDAYLDGRVTSLETLGGPDLAAHITDPTDAHDASAITFIQAGTGASIRTALAKMRETVSAADFSSIQAAIDALEAAGGGTLYCPPGNYLLPAGLVNDSQTINFIGAGEFVTTFTLDDGVDEAVLTFSQVNGGYFGGIGINGNRANQSSAGDGIVLDRSNNVVIERFYVRDCYRYGIAVTGAAAQRRHKILNGFIEDTGAHGVYINDDDTYTKQALVIDKVLVQRPGRNGALSNQACYHISGWTMLSNCFAREFEDEGATIAYLFAEGDEAPSVGANQTSAVNCHAFSAVYNSATIGFRLDARHIKLDACFASACGIGYEIRQQDASLVACHAHQGRHGFMTRASTGFDTDADKIMMVGCAAVLQSSGVTDGVGFDIFGDRNMIIGCLARNKNVGYAIESGATGTKLENSVALDNTTSPVTDAGTSSRIRGVDGFATEGKSQSTTFAIDSTGVKDLTIAHGLAVVPVQGDVSLTLARNTNVSDFEIGWMRIKGNPDATNVYVQVNVTTASATGGATAAVVMQVRSK